MKICVAALSNQKTVQVCSDPIRAPFFLFFDEEGNFLKYLWNPFSKGGGSLGYGLSRILQNERVDSLIAGGCHDGVRQILEESGIKVVIKKGKAVFLVEEFINETVAEQVV